MPENDQRFQMLSGLENHVVILPADSPGIPGQQRREAWLMEEIRLTSLNIPLFTGFYTSQVVQDFFHQQ